MDKLAHTQQGVYTRLIFNHKKIRPVNETYSGCIVFSFKGCEMLKLDCSISKKNMTVANINGYIRFEALKIEHVKYRKAWPMCKCDHNVIIVDLAMQKNC